MRLLVPLLLLLAAASAHAQPEADVEAELRATERAWLDAYDQHDRDAMDAILADSFTIVYQDGTVVNKAETLAALRPGTPANPAVRQFTEETVVRVWGDAAVLTGVYVLEQPGPLPGTTAQSRSRYTDTYIREDGRWRVVSSQLTSIEQ